MDTLGETQAARSGTGRAFRVLVTGSRTWDNARRVEGALSEACRTAITEGFTQLVVVHGAAPAGADKFAANWVRKVRTSVLEAPGSPVRLRVREQGVPAEWRTYGSRIAGFLRNQQMVDDGADLCLAFMDACRSVKCAGKPGHGTHGTADCITRAENAGIPVLRWAS